MGKRFQMVLVGGLILLSGCGKSTRLANHAEFEESNYRQGRAYLREGKQKEALQCFLKTTEKHQNASAEAHFEAAEIFLNYYKDPIAAIYHYREYLLQQPNSKQSHLVRQRIETAERAFVEQIPALRAANKESHQDQLKTIKLLQDENMRLKKQLASSAAKFEKLKKEYLKTNAELVSEKNLSEAEKNDQKTHGYLKVAQEKSELIDASTSKRYKVQQGDTLSSISQKIFGTANRWQEIYDLNRHLLKSPAHLKIGQELIVPK